MCGVEVVGESVRKGLLLWYWMLVVNSYFSEGRDVVMVLLER